VRGDLDAAVQGKLLQNVVHVALDGVGGDVEALGNLLVAQALSYQARNLLLALRHLNGFQHGGSAVRDRLIHNVGQQRAR
jgi:hypothetical protein